MATYEELMRDSDGDSEDEADIGERAAPAPRAPQRSRAPTAATVIMEGEEVRYPTRRRRTALVLG